MKRKKERKQYTASKTEPALLLHVNSASKKERNKQTKKTNKQNRCAASEDSYQPADAQADLSLRWAQRSFCWFRHEAAYIL